MNVDRVHPESTWTRPTDVCPYPERWSSVDPQATELEVINLIAALVGALQPDVVLETGTWTGWMAAAIGEVLADGYGRLVTIEKDPDVYAVAVERCAGLPVEVLNRSSLDVDLDDIGPHVGFAWFDSDPSVRVREFDRFLPLFDGRTIVGFHDTAAHHGGWSQAVRTHSRLRCFDLPTPRGVILGQVV